MLQRNSSGWMQTCALEFFGQQDFLVGSPDWGFPEGRQDGVTVVAGDHSKWHLALNSYLTGLLSSFLINFSFIKF